MRAGSRLAAAIAVASAAFATSVMAAPRACPPAGYQVEKATGAPIRYLGSVPGIPDLCRMDRGRGPELFYLGVWRSDWPGAGDAYPALREVIDGPPGTTASFVTRSIPGMQWQDTLTNEGPASVTVGGRRLATMMIAHERTGIDGNVYHSIITQWRVVATGAIVKVLEHQIAGQSYGPGTTWEAARVLAR